MATALVSRTRKAHGEPLSDPPDGTRYSASPVAKGGTKLSCSTSAWPTSTVPPLADLIDAGRSRFATVVNATCFESVSDCAKVDVAALGDDVTLSVRVKDTVASCVALPALAVYVSSPDSEFDGDSVDASVGVSVVALLSVTVTSLLALLVVLLSPTDSVAVAETVDVSVLVADELASSVDDSDSEPRECVSVSVDVASPLDDSDTVVVAVCSSDGVALRCDGDALRDGEACGVTVSSTLLVADSDVVQVSSSDCVSDKE